MAVTNSLESTYKWKSKEELLAEIAVLEQRLGDSEESLYRLRESATGTKKGSLDAGNYPLKRAEDRLQKNKERLIDAIHSLQEGFALFDSDDKLVVFNDVYKRLHALSNNFLKPGVTFEQLLRNNMANGTITESVGREEEFIQERIELHRNPKEKIIREWYDGSWYVISEVKTPRNGIIQTFNDITPLKMAEAELLEKSKLMELLQNVAIAANNEQTLDGAIQKCLDDICHHIDWPVGHAHVSTSTAPGVLIPSDIWCLEDEEKFGKFVEVRENSEFVMEGGLVDQVVRSCAPLWIPDLTKASDEFTEDMADELLIRSAFGLPVFSGDNIVAVLAFFTSEVTEPNEDLLETLAQVGGLLGRVVERMEAQEEVDRRMNELATEVLVRKRAEEKIQHLANHDALTGLPSLRLGKDRLANAIANAKRHKKKAAVMFVDLDGFKAVNDTLGHDVGDEVLKGVSERLLNSVREVDTVARIGGDEFTVVLTEVKTEDDAAVVAKKIIGNVSEPFVVGGGGAQTNIGASIGIAIFPDHGASAEELVHRGDQAMYSVKRQGKNNYAFASDIEADTGAGD
jgi:diguanylate cyclase (GGDEF)-like protein